MNFLDKNLEAYVQQHSDQEPELLQQLARETHLKVLQPRMLSGAYQGRLLALIAKLIAPKRVLEIGTYTGYSALCMAEGLPPNGRIDTIDIDEELTDIQRRYFEASGYGNQIFQHLGNAADVIPTLKGDFDLVLLMQIKKLQDYYNRSFDLLKRGGLIIIDNVLWHGEVADDKNNEKFTNIMRNFNTFVKNDERAEQIILPLGDGFTICNKL